MRPTLGAVVAASIAIGFAASFGCGKPSGAPALLSQPSRSQAGGSLALVSLAGKILGASGQSGSLVYEGSCAQGDISDPFKLTMPAHLTPAVAALNEAFALDPRLSVNVESGLIRIIGGNVPRDLLDLRLGHVAFRNEADPRDAVQRLLTLPEVRSYMEARGILWLTTLQGIYAPPTEGSPDLDVTLKDVTLSDALDRIVRTFPGMWTYRDCVEGHGHRAVFVNLLTFSPAPIDGGEGRR